MGPARPPTRPWPASPPAFRAVGAPIGSPSGKPHLVGNLTDTGAPMPFQRRKATPEDDARAREQAPKIHALGRAGVAPSEIARALRLPTASVESVLNSPERERPSGADASPGPALPGPAAVGFAPVESAIPGTPITSQLAGPYQITSTTDQVFQLAREAGLTEPFARGVARRFSYYAADNYDALDRILGESGVGKPARAYIVGGYREATGAPASPLAKAEEASPRREPEDPVDRHRRAMLADLEIRRQRAEVEKLEREARGEADGGGELSQLRAQVASLTAALREKEIVEQMSRHFGPLAERVKDLEGRLASSRKTKEDVSLEALGDSMHVVTERLKSAPQVLQKLDKVADMIMDTPILETAVQRRAQQVLSNVTGEPIPPPPVPPGDLEARYGAAAAEMDRLMEQDARPRYHIPGSAPIKEE